MPSSRWPTGNKLNSIFGGSLFHNVSGFFNFVISFIFFIFNPTSFPYSFQFSRDSSVCEEWMSVSLSVSCAYLWALLLLFVLSYSDLFIFVLS